MKDAIIRGNGNSRFMKSSIAADTTHEQLVGMLRDGTFPFDLYSINSSGFQQVGTPLNTGNMLPDALAARLGLSSTATLASFLDTLLTKMKTATFLITAYGEGVAHQAGTNGIICGHVVMINECVKLTQDKARNDVLMTIPYTTAVWAYGQVWDGNGFICSCHLTGGDVILDGAISKSEHQYPVVCITSRIND